MDFQQLASRWRRFSLLEQENYLQQPIPVQDDWLAACRAVRGEGDEKGPEGPARGGRWEGRWSGGLRLARPCRLVFRVVPGP